MARRGVLQGTEGSQQPVPRHVPEVPTVGETCGARENEGRGSDALPPGVRDDVDAPDERRCVIVFSRTLVLERSDDYNWELKQRVLVEGDGKNAGKHNWVRLGFYGTPGRCADKVAALRLVEELGLTASAVQAAGVYRSVEQGLKEALVRAERADAVEGARPGIAAKAREEALQEAAALLTRDEDRRLVLGLAKKRGG